MTIIEEIQEQVLKIPHENRKEVQVSVVRDSHLAPLNKDSCTLWCKFSEA